MQLGDFFRAAPLAKPICPKVIRFTAHARGGVLPGGIQNPNGNNPVKATITGAFVFLTGDQFQAARIQARESLRARFLDEKTKQPLPIERDDVDVETVFQLIVRAVHEWDEQEKQIGGPLFPSADAARGMLELREASRIMGEYDAYVSEEHPASVDEATFRESEGAGPRAPARLAG